MMPLIQEEGAYKYRKSKEENKGAVRISEKVIRNHTLNYLPKNIYNTHKSVYKLRKYFK